MTETNYKLLLSQVEEYVKTYFKSHYDAQFTYHNIDHTKRVVAAAKELGNHFQLNEKDFFTVVAAGWFHDIGYFVSRFNHEKEGMQIADTFLKKEGLDDGVISKVQSCIQATKMPQNPSDLLEEIVCDADLYHLGTDEFEEINKKLKKEIATSSGKKLNKREWLEESVKLLATHQYFTDYSRLVLNDNVSKNLKQQQKKLDKELKKELKSRGNSGENAVSAMGLAGNHIPIKNSKEKGKKTNGEKGDKNKKPGRGIETMFRVTSNNNQRLSRMADNKAHIMITVNSIILSAIISLLLRELDNDSQLTIPTYIILVVCVMTIIFSVLATRPTIPSGVFTQKNLDEKDVNLLFFGNFYKMSLEDYEKGMWDVMASNEFLYGSLIRDVYAQGVVLGKKYHYLRISYNIFMFGLIISVLGYIVATMV